MRPIAEASSRITGQNFNKKYVALGRVISAWAELAGADLSKKAQPVKIHYRKPDKSGTPNVILDIATSSADATLMHYQKDLILERINRIFGQNWITSIKFVPLPSETKSKARRLKTPATPLTKEQKNHLSQVLEPVMDTDLKNNLESLGKAILLEGQI